MDIASRSIEPAATLEWIPQGIDEVVPLDDCVAVRCGPVWFGLDPSLSGDAFELSYPQQATAQRRSHDLPSAWDDGKAPKDARVRMPLPDGEEWEVVHTDIKRWGLTGTLSPDRQALAIVGFTVPQKETRSVVPHSLDRGSLVVADSLSRDVRVYGGTFGGFGKAAWSADGGEIVVGAPYEPRCLFTASIDSEAIQRVTFRRHAPTPLIDATLIPPTSRGRTGGRPGPA